MSIPALQGRRPRFHWAACALVRTGILLIRRDVAAIALWPIAAQAERTWDEVAALPDGHPHP